MNTSQNRDSEKSSLEKERSRLYSKFNVGASLACGILKDHEDRSSLVTMTNHCYDGFYIFKIKNRKSGDTVLVHMIPVSSMRKKNVNDVYEEIKNRIVKEVF